MEERNVQNNELEIDIDESPFQGRIPLDEILAEIRY